MAEEVTRPCVIVPGASGQIGLFAIPRLVAAGYEVIALSRKGQPEGFPELTAVTWQSHLEGGGESRPESDSLPGPVMVLSAGPLGVAHDLLQQLPTARGLVAFSTTSVITKRASPDREERAEVQAIAEEEARIGDLCRQRQISFCLLRPTLIYGCGMDRNVSFLARAIQTMPWFPVSGRAAGLRQPVHSDDLAAAAVSALSLLDRLPAELFLCGGSTLPYREMLQRIAVAMGKRLRLVSLPEAVLLTLLRLVGWLPGLSGVRPEMVRRQGKDLVFDDRQARELLGYSPRAFRPRVEDFRRPDQAVLRRLAETA